MGLLTTGKYQNNTLLVKPDGEEEFAVDDLKGLVFLDLTVNSPQPQTNFVTSVGVDGSTQQGPVLYGSRTATINFYLNTDSGTFMFARLHEIWSMFFKRGLVRLRQTDEPGICVYGVAQPYEMTHVSRYEKTFSIQFNIPSGFRYSTVRSTQISNSVNDYSNVGMNLPNQELKYTQTVNDFRIYNPSDVDIEPYEQNHDLKIIFKGTGSPSLTNLDNGDNFTFNGKLTANDELVLDGVHPLLNGESCEINTNHGDVRLIKKTGNAFSVTHFTGSVTFDFPFIYL